MGIVACSAGYEGRREARFDDDMQCIGVDDAVLDGLDVSEAPE